MRKRSFLRTTALLTVMLTAFALPTAVYANAEDSPYYGFGTTVGRTDAINVNDYSTNSWERFIFNYLFESGGDYRYDLGQPTTYKGTVPNDVYSVNIRRDKNVTVIPPSYGVFSGNVATQQSNYLFDLPLDPKFTQFLSQAFQDDPNLIPKFDTLMMGANTPFDKNPLNVYNVDQVNVSSSKGIPSSGGFLTPTSVD